MHLQRKMIGQFARGSNTAYPPIQTMLQETAVPEKSRILAYMKRAECIGALPAIFRDALTDDIIPGDTLLKGDDVFCWFSDLEYYFEKYNFKLPDEFIQHVLEVTN